MGWILLCTIVLALAYGLLILYLLYHWSRIPSWCIPPDFTPKTRVSIVVPARNEAANIQACLQSILVQNYPPTQMEVIVVDDHSTDATATIVQSIADPRLHLLHLAEYPWQGQAYKKHGIHTAIQRSTGELILCTDADCTMKPAWLTTMVSFFEQNQVQMIAGPVNFYQEKSALERFQSLDFLGMILLTGAGLHSRLFRMGNGANLAYTRAAYEAVEGFSGVNHLASGDDLFLMHKIEKRFPGQVRFLKSLEATVYTLAMPNWSAFLQQRLRWGTKNAGYQEWQITAVLGLVFGVCWGILSLVLCLPCAPTLMGTCLAILLFTKVLADYTMLSRAAHYFHRKELLRSFAYAQVLHILYIALIGLLANVVKQYVWKGRKVR